MTRVLMVGNHGSVKGGITTVINQFREFNFKKNDIIFKFIPTYIDKNNLFKIFYFIFAYIRILIFCIFVRPNIIHIHMSYKGSFTRAYCIQRISCFLGIKNIIHLHGSEFKKWYDSLGDNKKQKVKSLLRDSDVFIVLGEKWNKVIKEIEPETKTLVLSNSIKISNCTTVYRNYKKILFLGVLIKRKGVHDLIEALNKLSNHNYKLIIAGEGVEEDNLKRMVKSYDLEDNVDFVGWINSEDKFKLLSNVQFMVLPSYNEGLPMSILEAMSYGVPVLSTNVGDIPSVVDENNGFLFEPGDIEKLSDILNYVIQLDEDTWNLFSKNSRETAEKMFSEDNYFDRILNLYIEVLE